MANSTPLNDDDRANLVAYLDGELDQQAARAVEERLSTDSEARTEASTLKKTWELLDHLPRTQPSTAFTSRTLQRISALRPPMAPSGADHWWQPWALGIGWGTAVCLAAVLGFIMISRVYPPPLRNAVAEAAPVDTQQRWQEQLPQAQREELQKLESQPNKHEARLQELFQEEHKRDQEWQVTIREWDSNAQRQQKIISQVQALRLEIEAYVDEALLPMLTPQERSRLRRVQETMKTKGQWQPFLRTLVALSDKHPIKLPGPSTGPSRFEELPSAVQKLLPDLRNPRPQLAERSQKVEGHWPEYAIFVHQIGNRRKAPIPALGPTRPVEFAAAIRDFINGKLIPALDAEEKAKLMAALGQWPQYPRVVLNLARAHHLQVPLMGLPGPHDLWDSFREKPAATATATAAGKPTQIEKK
jgi:hypothetical protein